MKHKFAESAIIGLLLCIPGCGKPVAESSLVGAWQFDVQRTIMVLNTNHTYSLKADDGRTMLGQWSLQGNRLIAIRKSWTDASGAVIAIRPPMINDTKVAKLTDSKMILQNWGGPASSLTRTNVSPP